MEALGPEELARYKEKNEDIGGQDPYKISPQLMSKDPTRVLSISYPDILNYLVFKKSMVSNLRYFLTFFMHAHENLGFFQVYFIL